MANDDEGDDYASEIARHIKGEQQSNPEAMFGGAQACARVGSPGSDKLVGFDAEGELDLNCLSQLKICMEDPASGSLELEEQFPKRCYTYLRPDESCPVPVCEASVLKWSGPTNEQYEDPGVGP